MSKLTGLNFINNTVAIYNGDKASTTTEKGIKELFDIDIKKMVACICPHSIKQDLKNLSPHIYNKIIFIDNSNYMNLWKWSDLAYDSILKVKPKVKP